MKSQTAIILIVLGLVGPFAFFTLITGLLPKIVNQHRRIAEEQLKRAFWLGLVNTVFLFLVAFITLALAEGRGTPILFLPVVLSLGTFATGALMGLSGTIQMVGERLFPDRSASRQTMYTVGLVLFGCITPFIGWYLLMPYLLLTGMGISVIGYFERRRKKSSQPE